MYNIQCCYIAQIVLAGVSENAFSLTLDPADINQIYANPVLTWC